MSSSMEELEIRLRDLKKFAEQVHADTRAPSFSLESKHAIAEDQNFVSAAAALRVPMHHPLTIGTLFASILGEIDSVEWALKTLHASTKHSDENG